jgi:hypothetical protein
VFALPLDSTIFDLYIHSLLFGLHAQDGPEDFGFLVATLMTDRNTSVAAEDENLPVSFDHAPNFFIWLLFADNHAMLLLPGAFAVRQPDGRWTEVPDSFSKFRTDFSPSRSFGRREVIHLQAFRIDSHLGNKGFEVLDSLLGV